MREVKNSATHRRLIAAGYLNQISAPFINHAGPVRNSIQWLLFFAHSASGNRNSASGAPTNVGSNGNYWSETPSSATNARNLNFNSGAVNPQNTNNRANGFAVRCVAEFLG